ncbi:MAG: hypothetical protein ACRD41_02885, partial [Candidatus Acidiferrales bacterium]
MPPAAPGSAPERSNMKTLLALLLFASPAFAQKPASAAAARFACGPANVKFDATAGQPLKSLQQPDPGKAMVYVVESFEKVPNELGNPTIKVGLNGAWMGAMRESTFISFPVTPGEQHLCVNWQSVWGRFSNLYALQGFTAEAGKSYFFKARITEDDNVYRLRLVPLGDSDESRF